MQGMTLGIGIYRADPVGALTFRRAMAFKPSGPICCQYQDWRASALAYSGATEKLLHLRKTSQASGCCGSIDCSPLGRQWRDPVTACWRRASRLLQTRFHNSW